MRRYKAVVLVVLIILNALAFIYSSQINEWIAKRRYEWVEHALPSIDITMVSDKITTSRYDKENLTIGVSDDGYLVVSGVTNDTHKKYIMVTFESDDPPNSNQKPPSQNVFPINMGESFSKTIDIPKTGNPSLKVQIYANIDDEGIFKSWLYNQITIEQTDKWTIRQPELYSQNASLFYTEKSYTSDFVQKITANIQDLSDSITVDCETDYQKIVAIHDWVCSNIYYDMDISNNKQTIMPDDTVSGKKTKCSGYAALTSTLVRAQSIPCRTVSGYALGIDDSEWNQQNTSSDTMNHDWNEAYVDGRWIIMDTTWDSANVYQNGEFVSAPQKGYTYFDCELQFFSLDHRIMEYR